MLHRPTLSIDTVDRNEYRLPAPVTPNEKEWLTTIGFAVLGCVLVYPLLGLSYITFPLAFAGFTMLPFLVAAYLWYRDDTSSTPRIVVSKIVTPQLLPQLPPKSPEN